jgi:hypothetical protein
MEDITTIINDSNKQIIKYIGVRTINGTLYDGNDGSEDYYIWDYITENTEHLVECIKQIKSIRNNDIKNYKKKYLADFRMCTNGSCFSITYSYDELYSKNNINITEKPMSEVLKELECKYICEDIYKEVDEYESDDEKDFSDGNYYNILESKKYKLFNIDQEERFNIKKLIDNSKQSDTKKLTWIGKGKLNSIGNITYEDIVKLLKIQEYKCYICSDIVLTYSYVPYCSYKFSIDRLDNNKPHDQNNIKISCYFCNCKEHISFNKKIKQKCNDIICSCNY